MTVKELIEELQKHDPDKLVLVTAYEEGYNELSKVEQIKTFYEPSDKHCWYPLYSYLESKNYGWNISKRIQRTS